MLPSILLRAPWTAPVGCLVLAAVALAEDPPRRDEQAADRQLVQGVIVKVEPCDKEDASKGLKATINTAAVWRDYVRDTTSEKGSSVEKAAQKGEDSVATKGQPEAPETLVHVEIARDPAAVLHYRTATDERTLGAPTPAAARKIAEADAEDSEEAPTATAKAIKPADIKKGLFVHVRYHREGDRNIADRVVILEPVRDEKGR
jgi:hypothetical protein